MYNVRKMLNFDSNPLIRLEKRLALLRRTHNAGLNRSVFLSENNFNTNRQLMENLILRLHSFGSKSKKNKRVGNRIKVGSPKKMRSGSNKPQEMCNDHFSGYTEFQSKLHTVKRAHQPEYCGASDTTFFKELKELPPLHPSEVETVLRAKGTSSRNSSERGEPVFPPAPFCTISARSSIASVCSSNVLPIQRVRKAPQPFNQIRISSEKYIAPTTSCATNFSPCMRPSLHPSPYLPASCPYVDLHDPDCYQSTPSSYNQFALPGFSNGYNFNPYTCSSGYATWASLEKYDQNMPNQITPSSISISTPSYRSYPTTTDPEDSSGFTASLPFNQSFQDENFARQMPAYPPSVNPQQPTYELNLSSYNYHPQNTTSYM